MLAFQSGDRETKFLQFAFSNILKFNGNKTPNQQCQSTEEKQGSKD